MGPIGNWTRNYVDNKITEKERILLDLARRYVPPKSRSKKREAERDAFLLAQAEVFWETNPHWKPMQERMAKEFHTFVEYLSGQLGVTRRP